MCKEEEGIAFEGKEGNENGKKTRKMKGKESCDREKEPLQKM